MYPLPPFFPGPRLLMIPLPSTQMLFAKTYCGSPMEVLDKIPSFTFLINPVTPHLL